MGDLVWYLYVHICVCEGTGDPEGDPAEADKAKGRDDRNTTEVGSLVCTTSSGAYTTHSCASGVHVWAVCVKTPPQRSIAVTRTAFNQFFLALGVSPVTPLVCVADSDHRAMDTAESRLRECKQIAARLKEEMEQKAAQHSRTAGQGTTAMDTSSSSSSAAPPQVGSADMVASPTSSVRSCRLLFSPCPPLSHPLQAVSSVPTQGTNTPCSVPDMCDYVDALVQTLEGAPRAYYTANGQ